MKVRVQQLWEKYQVETMIAALVFVAVAPWMGNGLSNETPRVALSAALVENGTVEITEYRDLLFDDYSVRDDRLYSDKAPGTSFLFVPVYALGRVFGLDVVESTGEVKFLAKIVFSAVPAAILAFLVSWRTRRFGPRSSTAVALILAFGTILLPFSTVAFGHITAALLGFGALSLVFARRTTTVTSMFAGALVGMAVVVEYPMAIIALVLLCAIGVTDARRLPWFIGGASPFAILLLGYHWIAFGNPFHTPYRYAAVFEGDFPGVGIGWPDLGVLTGTLLGERGLFVLTPIVLVAAAGFFLQSDHQLGKSEFRSTVAIVVAFAIVPAVWVDQAAGAIGGYSPGPRFVTPALPFLAVPLAAALARWPRIVVATSLISVAIMALATVTDPLAPDDKGTSALEHWLTQARDGIFRKNILVEAIGPLGLAIHLTLVVLVGLMLLRTLEPPEANRRDHP